MVLVFCTFPYQKTEKFFMAESYVCNFFFSFEKKSGILVFLRAVVDGLWKAQREDKIWQV